MLAATLGGTGLDALTVRSSAEPVVRADEVFLRVRTVGLNQLDLNVSVDVS